MGTHRLHACAPGDGTENDNDGDRVVRVAEHGDEVGDQVDRQGQIGQHEAEPDPDLARQRRVRDEPSDQAKYVR
jgi:hypothetical protein